jgi:hypothetical protein
VVLNKADLDGDVNADLFPPFQGVWQPSQSEVRAAIQRAREHMVAERAEAERTRKDGRGNGERGYSEEILAKWDKYVCQAVGHRKGGRKLIHLNFLPRDEFSNPGQDPTTWRHHYVVVFDGGTDFWQCDYDCDTHECLNFEANGVA